MFKIGIHWHEAWALAFVLGLCVTPLAAATVISYRSHRGGWWIGSLWGGFLGVFSLAMLFFSRVSGGDGDGASASDIALSLFIGAWLSLSGFLIALAIAGPKPGLTVRDVF